MIDLRNKGLPNTIVVDGRSFSIKTDFREWLKFGELMESNCTIHDISHILNGVNERDINDRIVYELMMFYNNPNATPNALGDDSSMIKTMDYILDGEYIVGSFMAVYGIDLTDCDMHWHKFKALLCSLPDDCKLRQIMGFRSYKKDNKSHEQNCKEMKKIWQLPSMTSEEESEILDGINDEFYNS